MHTILTRICKYSKPTTAHRISAGRAVEPKALKVLVAASCELHPPTRPRNDLHEPVGFLCTSGTLYLGRVVIELGKPGISESVAGEEVARGLAQIAGPTLWQPHILRSH